MNYKPACFFFIAILITGCKTSHKRSPHDVLDFQSDLDSQVNENMPGILATVISEERNIYWNGAAGYSDKENKIDLLPGQTFRIASVTKTFVAATILRLWEQGKLNLDDAITKYISDEHVEILEKGGYNPQEITIYHLLTHSSGLSDHTRTEKYEMDFLKTNHAWTRTEQLEDLVKYQKPAGKVGQKFSYSDSGYILLGEIIETITRQSLGDAISGQLELEEMGLKSIHMENDKGEFSDSRIHQYYENEDTYSINPTFDLFGGGGLLATTRDLGLFYQYLFDNRIFEHSHTLDTMLSPVNYPDEQSLDYRMGIWKTEINGMQAYTHMGFWGTQVIYIPEIKTSIAVNCSQRWTNQGEAPVIPVIVAKLTKE
jgi:D-alanyl-D-alanine carboxypeptidase